MPRSALSLLSAVALAATVSVAPAIATPQDDATTQGGGSIAAVDVERLSGPNRYETAADIARQWTSPVNRVYVVSGHTFPDALTAAARAGADDAPVLLTKADHIPGETVNALERLSPSGITVIGGTTAVSGEILSQLGDLAGPEGVERIDGGNRYATSAQVAAGYEANPERVYLASGEDYPDALSAAAIAGTHHEPLLLTHSDSLPSQVAAQLNRLNPREVVVIGGTGAVSDGVAAEAASYARSGAAVRIAGENRYETSAAVATEFSSDVTSSYVASGQGFADALVVSGLAGREQVPVILTQRANLPSGAREALELLAPGQLFVAGGPAAVSDSVIAELSDDGDPGPGPEFPDESNTGVSEGVSLTPSDSLTITKDGTVVDGLHVSGTITIDADNVTVRNTLVQGGGDRYPIDIKRGADNAVVEHVELDNLNDTGIGMLIKGAGTTVRAANIHSAEDGIRIEADTVMIEDSYIHDLHRQEGGHHDSIQIRKGDNVTIRGNNLQAYVESTDDPMNAAIQVGSLAGNDPITNFLVEDNLMNGGNFTINGGFSGDVESARYANNRFGRDFRYGVQGNLRNSVWEDTNVWHDTGAPAE